MDEHLALFPDRKEPDSPVHGQHRRLSLLRGPADFNDIARLSVPIPSDGPYLFRYSLTGYGLGLTDYGLEGDRNYGMSSVFMGAVDHPTAYPSRSASVQNPARKIMFAEEPSSVGGTDKPPQSNGLPIQDGRWPPGNMWTSDYLTTRHAGKA